MTVVPTTSAFVVPPPAVVVVRRTSSLSSSPVVATTTTAMSATGTKIRRTNHERLMDDFRLASGEVVNPYRTLKIPRDGEKSAIKKKYYELSKLYHPDRARFSDILPGKCDDLDEVAEEWERIKFSYEILSDRKTRAKYDRNSAITDPSATLGRTAVELLGWGARGVGAGMFLMGKGIAAASEVAVKGMASELQRRDEDRRRRRKEEGNADAGKRSSAEDEERDSRTRRARDALRRATRRRG